MASTLLSIQRRIRSVREEVAAERMSVAERKADPASWIIAIVSGLALCGYVLNPSSNTNGETVLSNMKPKTASEWSGNVYSRDSGSTYYATIAMKGPDSLRVEACALGG